MVGMELAARAGYDPARRRHAVAEDGRRRARARRRSSCRPTHRARPGSSDIEANLPKVEGLYQRAPRPGKRFAPPPPKSDAGR